MDAKSSAKQLHDSLNLYVSDLFYSFEPQDRSLSLTINRSSGHISLEPPAASRPLSVKRAERVFGILGLLSLTTSDFIVVITGRQFHGRIFGHEVYLATDFKVLPLDRSPTHEHSVESHLLALVRAHLFGGTFWFSYTWDLTRRLQAQRMTREQDAGKALWEVADDRFFWNKFLHSRFIDITTSSDQNLSRYILPVIYGTFEICDASINSRSFQFGLISRRSRYRAGTRYFTRGVDEAGHVANFNETEQLVMLDGSISNEKHSNTVLSFVQTRGSVPVFWAEVNNLRYTPDLQIMELKDTALAFRLHFQEQVTTYGSQHVLNLVKQKGREKLVKEAYERYVAETDIPKVQYDHFDFHKECSNMQFHRVDILIDRIKDDLGEKGYFHDDEATPTPRKLQTGTMRTNCMDNLDRTNIVQSALGKWSLTQQLRVVGILLETEKVEDFENFMLKFRQIWADHADSISKAYSGTGALKTDLTRTGKRTGMGVVQDGVNSVMRYLKNNYFDGARQDAFDIFTGAWVPREGPGISRSLLFDSRPLIVRSMPYLLSFSIFMVFAGLTLPRSSDYSLVYYFFMWICLASLSLGYIFSHGIDYVSWPRLNPPVDTIYYNGPGHRTGQRGKRSERLAPRPVTIGHNIGRPRGNSRLDEVEMGSVKKRLD